MLTLDRRLDEKIRITVRDEQGFPQHVCEFSIIERRGKKFKIGFEASVDVEIFREELVNDEDISELLANSHEKKGSRNHV